MRRHLARILERAAVLQVSGDAGAAKGVVADLRGDAGCLGATAYHLPSVDAVEPFPRQFRLPAPIGAMLDGLEEGSPPRFAQPSALGVFGEVALERVVAGHLVE